MSSTSLNMNKQSLMSMLCRVCAEPISNTNHGIKLLLDAGYHHIFENSVQGLPEMVCNKCDEKLKFCANFYKMTKASQLKLMEYVEKEMKNSKLHQTDSRFPESTNDANSMMVKVSSTPLHDNTNTLSAGAAGVYCSTRLRLQRALLQLPSNNEKIDKDLLKKRFFKKTASKEKKLQVCSSQEAVVVAEKSEQGDLITLNVILSLDETHKEARTLSGDDQELMELATARFDKTKRTWGLFSFGGEFDPMVKEENKKQISKCSKIVKKCKFIQNKDMVALQVNSILGSYFKQK